MAYINFSVKYPAHITDLGRFHFSVVRWFERQRLLHPHIGELAAACTIVVSHVQRSIADESTSYQALLNVVENWDKQAAVMPPEIFSQLIESFRNDAGVAKYRWSNVIAWEPGPAGRFRRGMWASGLREPELSMIVEEFVRATKPRPNPNRAD